MIEKYYFQVHMRSISIINFRMVEMNFGCGDTNFGVNGGNVRPDHTQEFASIDTKVCVSTTKVHLNHPKVDNGDGPHVDLEVIQFKIIFLQMKIYIC